EQHVGDPVEHLGDGAGAPADLRAQLLRLALQPPPALCPPRVRFTLGTRLAGVCLHPLAQLRDAPLPTIALRPALAALTAAAALGSRVLLLEVGEFAPQPRVLLEVAEMALHRLGVFRQRRLLLAHTTSQIDDGPVGLELGERAL